MGGLSFSDAPYLLQELSAPPKWTVTQLEDSDLTI